MKKKVNHETKKYLHRMTNFRNRTKFNSRSFPKPAKQFKLYPLEPRIHFFSRFKCYTKYIIFKFTYLQFQSKILSRLFVLYAICTFHETGSYYNLSQININYVKVNLSLILDYETPLLSIVGNSPVHTKNEYLHALEMIERFRNHTPFQFTS